MKRILLLTVLLICLVVVSGCLDDTMNGACRLVAGIGKDLNEGASWAAGQFEHEQEQSTTGGYAAQKE